MKTLVLNCGSSSLKYQLINTDGDKVLVKGVVEKIGGHEALFTYCPAGGKNFRDTLEAKNHAVALDIVLRMLTDSTSGVIKNITEIDAVGHRVVHGGETYSEPVIITDEVIAKIDACSIFAPLHNPPNLIGIRSCLKIMPGVKQVAVFDTAFHQKMPKMAFHYALPYSMYSKHGIRRYGFHGTSHSYVSRKAAEILKPEAGKDFKVIVCHLGNGASVAAIKNGISVDTSMGFTPLEGLIMGTRCGDIDPAIVTYLIQKLDINPAEVDKILNQQSGLKGIAQTTNDMREIREEALEGSELHQLAIDMFCYRVKKYIGSYSAVLGGVDAVIFTAGIGENDSKMRSQVVEGLQFLGIEIDPEKNANHETIISTGITKVMVIQTNEELAIAHETRQILQQQWNESKKEKERKQTREMLSKISGPERTKIILLWSHDQGVPKMQLLEKIKESINLDLSVEVFDELLLEMGIQCK